MRKLSDFPGYTINNVWTDFGGATDRRYVVETNPRIVERCILMTTDPGDLVLDPTCGSGTTATVAEQWGRRWITIDTSRVALALARTRLMSTRYPYYLLADSKEGRDKGQEVSGKLQPGTPTNGDIRQGFVYERAARITLGSIAKNAAIDEIWERWQATLEPLRANLNKAQKQSWEEWQIPREAEAGWSDAVKKIHAAWWEARVNRQNEIDDSIAKAADVEYLYDRPYVDNTRVRVAGPFTVESLSPHRVIPSGDIELAEGIGEPEKKRRAKLAAPPSDFTAMVIEHLRSSGVQQGAKGDRIELDPISGWPGEYIGAEGIFMEKNGKGPVQRSAAILIGPEFGTLSRVDLVAAAREATEARFDVLIGQSVHRVRRTRHRRPRARRRPDRRENQRRRRVRPEHRRHPLGRYQEHRCLVHRHGLQRGELLRAPRLLPGRQRSVQISKDRAARRNRRGSLGNTVP
nr:DNA methyltransferase [Hyphomicrobium methylovorum]